MRPIERIDNFLKLVDWKKLARRWLFAPIVLFDKCGYADIVDIDVVPYWKNNPDQRIGQVLINLGLISDTIQIWSDEEHDILISQGVNPEDCVYWGVNYDKNRNPLPKTEWKLISELTTDHIEKILEEVHKGMYNISNDYITIFKSILLKRKNDILL
jgi:hypothetical protein